MKVVSMGGKLAGHAKSIETIGRLVSNTASFAICAEQTVSSSAAMWNKYHEKGAKLSGETALEILGIGLNVAGMAASGKGIVESGNRLGKMLKEGGTTNKMSKGISEGGSNAVIKNIQSKSPQQLIEDGWEDITNPKMAANTNSREFYDPKSGLKIRYDKGVGGENGFEAVDHYHVMNPNYTNKKVDYYLDIDGKPVGKGSKASHIVIKGEE